MEKVFIYSLEFPEGNIRYIGKSKDPFNRIIDHIEESKCNTKTHKQAWINGLLKENLIPVLNIIDEVSENSWRFWEKYWISQYKTWGFNLTNGTEGGDGLVNSSKEVKIKISKSLKEYYSENNVWNKGTKGISSGWPEGKKQSDEHRKKNSEAKIGKNPWNKGLIGVQEAWNKGKVGVMPEPWNKDTIMPQETKDKVSISCKEAYKNKKEIECPWCHRRSKNNKFLQFHFDNCKLNPDYTPVKLKIITCTYCGLEGGGSSMKRWHFDNCKLNPKNL